jgi:hypothetical protein
MSNRRAIDQQNRKKIEDWLLALLKFAITRDITDRTVGSRLNMRNRFV